MSIHKILIDYNEYVRLCNIEEKYEKLLQSGQSGQSGSGTSVARDVLENEQKNELMTPLVKRLPPITLPASATISNEAQVEDEQTEPWYFLGKPMQE